MSRTCDLDYDVSSAVQACCKGLGHGTFASEKNMSMGRILGEEGGNEQLCMNK